MSWSSEILGRAHAEVLARMDEGVAAGPAEIRILDSADNTLVVLPLAEPAGSVDPGTGALILTPGPLASAVLTGEAVSATVSDSDGVALGSGFAVQSGTTAVPGAVVLSSVNIVSGGSVELVSAQIGE